MAKDCCDQLCNDPTDSIEGVAEASMITPDYHPAADAARLKVTELDQSLEQLKKKLRDRENKLKQQQDRVKKHQDAVNEVGQWLDEKEHQLKDYDLTEVEPAKIQEKMSAIKVSLLQLLNVTLSNRGYVNRSVTLDHMHVHTHYTLVGYSSISSVLHEMVSFCKL